MRVNYSVTSRVPGCVRNRIDRFAVMQSDRRTVQPTLGLGLRAEHARRVSEDFGKAPEALAFIDRRAGLGCRLAGVVASTVASKVVDKYGLRSNTGGE